jgi:CrcB protein
MLALVSICAGACLGAVARWQLGLWLNPRPDLLGASIPMGTLAANLIGGYLVGLVVGVLQAMPELNPLWRLALVTGFLGALTTFSSFSAEVVTMLVQQRYALALATTTLHVVGSLLLTLLGLHSAALWFPAKV